ncbi:gamma-glutamyl-gamma-aminobutyrate hydrolase family protein [bacterium]|nr:gamma-glutamyl-gamma-aminobutyrate hydrolase family protein [bacterium]
MSVWRGNIKTVERASTELKRKIYVLGVIALFIIALCAFGVKAAEREKLNIAVAWSNAQDSYSYKSVIASVNETGANAIILDMAKSYDLRYAGGRLTEGKDSRGMLTGEAAKRVKVNTWLNSDAEELMKGIDAVVFPGGVDISTTLYYDEQEWHGIEDDADYCAERDVSDYLLMSYCLEKDIPVLAICRGMQMLSVVSGADMIQDLGVFFQSKGLKYNGEHRDPRKLKFVPHAAEVLSRDSLLYRAAGKTTLSGCPSWHHQAVKDIADTRLTVTALAYTDGIKIIEAVERRDRTFCLGLQFHPEVAVNKSVNKEKDAGEFMDYDTAMSFFRSLLEAAAAKKQKTDA